MNTIQPTTSEKQTIEWTAWSYKPEMVAVPSSLSYEEHLASLDEEDPTPQELEDDARSDEEQSSLETYDSRADLLEIQEAEDRKVLSQEWLDHQSE